MPKRRYSAEEIIAKLREAEVLLGQGKPVAEVAKALGIDETTDYRWRAGYEGYTVALQYILLPFPNFSAISSRDAL